MDERALELYRQRYETWRHLDRIRYQTIQLAIAVLAAFGVFVQAANGEVLAIALFVFGLVNILFSIILRKVNDGIVGNGGALREYGKLVGDNKIPDVSDRKASVFYYGEWILLMLGLASLMWWAFKVFPVPS